MLLLVKKRRKRRWLYKKASSDSSAIDFGINLRNVGNINSTAVDVIAAEETEKTASPTAKETVFFCRTSVYLKRHVAAILIQTAFRGCLVISILFTSIALMLLYHLYFCISYTSHVSL